MRQPTHMGVTTLTAGAWYFYNPVFSVFYLLLPVWAILADADHNNRITQKLGFRIFHTKHRTWTHTVWFPFLIIIGFVALSYFVNGVSFSLFDYKTLWVLIMSHSLADVFTKQGVRFFYPLNLPFRIPIASTGKTSEKIFQIVLFGVLVTMGFLGVQTGLLQQFLAQFQNFLVSSEPNIVYFSLTLSFVVLFFLFSKEAQKYNDYLKKVFTLIMEFISYVILPFVGAFYLFNQYGLDMNSLKRTDGGIGLLVLMGLFFLYKYWKILIGVLSDQLLYIIVITLHLVIFGYGFYVLI